MVEKNNSKKKTELTQEHKVLFKNTFYSYLYSYGSYVFSLINSFIIARLITIDLWGYLILAISITGIISIFLTFLPPGLESSLNYYLAVYKAQQQKKKMKSLIKYAIYQRFIFVILVLIISLVIFYGFSAMFISLNNYVYLLFILSPLILNGGFGPVLTGINRGFDMFKTMFYLLVIQYTINIGLLIIVGFFLKPNTIDQIAYIHLFSIMIPLIVNAVLILIKYINLEEGKDIQGLTFKQCVKMNLGYGTYFTLGSSFVNIWERLKTMLVGNFENSIWVTGYDLSNNYSIVPLKAISALKDPLVVSFSRLYSDGKDNQVKKIFNSALYYTSFFFMLGIGIFYFLSDFFLIFVYQPNYLMFSLLIKILLLSTIFKLLGPQINSLIYATKKVKFEPIYRISTILIEAIPFIIGLLVYGIIGAIIFIVISSIVNFIIRLILCEKMFKIPLNLKKVLILFICFFSSLGIVILLKMLFLDFLNYQLLKMFNLLFFEELEIIPIVFFIMIFILSMIVMKVFSYEDILILENLFEKNKRAYKFLKKFKFLLLIFNKQKKKDDNESK
ncbi:MAG: lipopolysaccharide biosynthesis protein [Promethearchaeota archaeon]